MFNLNMQDVKKPQDGRKISNEKPPRTTRNPNDRKTSTVAPITRSTISTPQDDKIVFIETPSSIIRNPGGRNIPATWPTISTPQYDRKVVTERPSSTIRISSSLPPTEAPVTLPTTSTAKTSTESTTPYDFLDGNAYDQTKINQLEFL